MGLAGLTAVFGMGTGVTPPVWSPEKRPAGGQAGPVTQVSGGLVAQRTSARSCERVSGVLPPRDQIVIKSLLRSDT